MSKGGNMLQQQKKKTRKMDYFAKLSALLAEYPNALIVAADNVGSLHLQQVRRELRGKAVLLMGKNTLIRKCIRDNRGKNRALDALLPHVKGNVGFIFARDWVDLADLRASVEAVQAQAPARVGAVAPCAVVVPGGPTFLDPAKTNFFASLNIPTRIYRGTIEIMFDVPVLAAGEKVTATHAALFKRLDMKPFRYQLVVRSAYVDGEVHPASMLDVTSDHVVARLTQGVADVAALSLRLGYPTAVSVPHALAHSFHQLLAVSLATDYTFRQAAPIKQLLADPAALALARAAAAGYSVAPAVGGREDDDDDGDDDDEGEILIDFEDW